MLWTIRLVLTVASDHFRLNPQLVEKSNVQWIKGEKWTLPRSEMWNTNALWMNMPKHTMPSSPPVLKPSWQIPAPMVVFPNWVPLKLDSWYYDPNLRPIFCDPYAIRMGASSELAALPRLELCSAGMTWGCAQRASCRSHGNFPYRKYGVPGSTLNPNSRILLEKFRRNHGFYHQM